MSEVEREPEEIVADDVVQPSQQVTVDAASIAQFNDIKDEQKRHAHEEAAFWQHIFASPVGRRAMWKLLNEFNTFKTVFATTGSGVPDPLATWYGHGQQMTGQAIYQRWLVRHTAEIGLMHQECDDRLKPPPKPRRTRN